MEWNAFQKVENHISFSEFSTLQIFQFLSLRYFDVVLQQYLRIKLVQAMNYSSFPLVYTRYNLF